MENPRGQGGQAGASVSLAGDSGSSTSESSETQLHAVDVFADWTSDAERPLRIRIYRARDRMTARANRSKHRRAQSIYRLGSDVAGDWAFWPADVDALQEVLENLSRIFMVAQAIERLEAPDAD